MPTDAVVKYKNCYSLKNALKMLVTFLPLFLVIEICKKFTLSYSYIIASLER